MSQKTTIAVALAAVAVASPATAERGADGELRILSWQAPSNPNPYLAGGSADTRSSSLVLEPLARFDNTGTITPWLAQDIPTLENGRISEDLMSITWTLKSGILWSDGTPLTSKDVKFTADYCMHPAVGCAVSNRFNNVKDVEVIDDLTVKVNFKSATPFSYTAFVGFSSPIIQAAQFADCLGEKAPQCTDENFGPIGTGPFVIKEFRPKDVILLDANPNYRDPAKPAFATVTYKGGGDATAAARAIMQTGEFDYALNLQVSPEVIADIKKGGKGVTMAAFGPGVEIAYLNGSDPDPALGPDERAVITPNPKLKDLAVRRAMSMAIDRNLLVEIGYGDAGKVTCNLVPAPEIYNSDTHDCSTQDIVGANKMLDDAGWVRGADGIRSKDGVRLELSFQTSTNPVRQDFQVLLKEWWKQIGIDTELRNLNASVFFSSDPSSPDTYLKFYADVEMFANSFSGTDPQGYLAQLLCGRAPSPATQWSGPNVTRHCNPRYDELFAELAKEANLAKRAELGRALNDLIIDEQIIIPLVQRGDLIGRSNSLKGVVMNVWDSDFWNIADWSRQK